MEPKEWKLALSSRHGPDRPAGPWSLIAAKIGSGQVEIGSTSIFNPRGILSPYFWGKEISLKIFFYSPPIGVTWKLSFIPESFIYFARTTLITTMAEIERKAFQDLATEVKQKSDEAAAIIESLKSKKSNSEAGLSFLQLKNVLVSSATIFKLLQMWFLWIRRH